MIKFVKHLLMMLFLVFLSSCGFTPLYTTDEEGSLAELRDIRVAVISNRDGQMLRNHLVTLLTPYGVPEDPRYTLTVTLHDEFEHLGILKDATASVTQATFKVTFSLRDRRTYEEMVTGYAQASSNYNTIPSGPYSTLTEAEYTRKKAMTVLAQDIRRQLAAYFLLQGKDNAGAFLRDGKITKKKKNST